MDPFKRAREIAMIRAMTATGWRRALDFGCGVGRNFAALIEGKAPGAPGRLFAVDADPARLDEARATAAGIGAPDVSIDFSGELDAPGLEVGSLDLALCCQVITHMPTEATAALIARCAELLAPGGVFVICAPFHRSSAAPE